MGGSSVQFNCSVVSDSLRPHGLQHARPPCPSPTPGVYSNSMSIELVMPPNDLILCCPLLLPPSIFPSIRVFSNELVLRIRWPKNWSFSFSISPSNEYSGLICFKMDWFDLLAIDIWVYVSVYVCLTSCDRLLNEDSCYFYTLKCLWNDMCI